MQAFSSRQKFPIFEVMRDLLISIACLFSVSVFGQEVYKSPTSATPDNILTFPPLTGSVLDDAIQFKVWRDTTITLSSLDYNMKGSIKFNWMFDESYDGDKTKFYKIIGIQSFEVTTTDAIKYYQDLSTITSIEAFPDWDDTSYFYKKPYKTVFVEDLNLDGFMDLITVSSSGKTHHYNYFFYDSAVETFVFDKNIYSLRPYSIDKTNKIIYSYDDGMVNEVILGAYKLINNELVRIQTESTVWLRDSVIITTYTDQENNILHQIEEPILTDN